MGESLGWDSWSGGWADCRKPRIDPRACIVVKSIAQMDPLDVLIIGEINLQDRISRQASHDAKQIRALKRRSRELEKSEARIRELDRQSRQHVLHPLWQDVEPVAPEPIPFQYIQKYPFSICSGEL